MTFEFTKYYHEFVQHASIVIHRNRVTNYDKLESVNDVYILLSETDANPEQFKSKLTAIILNKKREGSSIISLDNTFLIQTSGSSDTTRHCKKCNESLPIYAFKLYKHKNRPDTFSANCKGCINLCVDKDKYNALRRSKYAKNHPGKRASKQAIEKKHLTKSKRPVIVKPVKIKISAEQKRLRWNEYMKMRRPKKFPNGKPKQSIIELWKKANAKRYQKEKELLLDSYIVRLLKAAKQKVNPKTIFNKRQCILSKRKMAA